MAKSDDLQYDFRVRTVIDWILAGFMTKDIIHHSSTQWNVDDRMCYKYLKSAKKILHETRKGKLEERIDFYIAAKMKLYNNLKDKDTPKGAQVADNILNSMARLEGAVIDKLDVTSKGEQIKSETKIIEVSLDI